MHYPPIHRTLHAVCPRGARSAASAAAVIAFAIVAGTAAQAQATHPVKPVKLVVGFAPGGPTDILARVIGAGMSKALGEQFYVENRTGAGGNIATEAVARAEPDGHTMQLTLMTAAVNESCSRISRSDSPNISSRLAASRRPGWCCLCIPRSRSTACPTWSA